MTTAVPSTRSLPLFAVRRADIEGFARDLEAKGRARATVTRRLSTIAGCARPRSERAGRPDGGNPAGAAVRYDQNSAAAAGSED
jgi:hypothetical protein